MKKRIAILLIVALIVSSVSCFSAAFAAEASYTATSYCPQNYVSFSINGDKLTATGSIVYDGLTNVWLICGNEDDVVSAESGKSFSATVRLALNETTPVKIFISNDGQYATYYSYIYQNIFITPSEDGYVFTESPVLKHNVQLESAWANPADHMNYCSANESEFSVVADLAASIVGTEQNNYEKLFLLNKWVATNICYDNDYFYGRSSYVSSKPVDVIKVKHAVCVGYANLLKDLIISQGIPAMTVSTYALGVGTSGKWDSGNINITTPNHSHVEAFVDGRWVIMDPTFDSRNTYDYGKSTYKTPNFHSFDMTLESYSWSYKTLSRDHSAEVNIPSDWAQKDVLSAISYGFVPSYLQGNYVRDITREQFCSLAINTLCALEGVDNAEGLLAKHSLAYTGTAFSDCSNPSVEAAFRLGIVSGTGNGMFTPSAYITRQEAAILLCNLSNYLGLNPAASPLQFEDESTADDWAQSAVKQITRYMSNSGVRIMNGTSSTQFSPLEGYTIEQSIITLLRLYNISIGE